MGIGWLVERLLAERVAAVDILSLWMPRVTNADDEGENDKSAAAVACLSMRLMLCRG